MILASIAVPGTALTAIAGGEMLLLKGTDDGFKMVASEATVLKRRQLEHEISSLPTDSPLRASLLHTFSKLFMFLEEDIRMALKEAARNSY